MDVDFVVKAALVIFINYLPRTHIEQFSELTASLHRRTQLKLPITLVGIGLPSLWVHVGNAKPQGNGYSTIQRFSRNTRLLTLLNDSNF